VLPALPHVAPVAQREPAAEAHVVATVAVTIAVTIRRRRRKSRARGGGSTAAVAIAVLVALSAAATITAARTRREPSRARVVSSFLRVGEARPVSVKVARIERASVAANRWLLLLLRRLQARSTS
jgi:hypothetical protein